MDIATLGIAIDSGDVKTASSDLNSLAASARRAEQAAGKMAPAIKTAAVQTGNLAAQFSDIGVQLAGGQSPFLIALQQGSQITQAFGNAGVRGAIMGVGSALLSLVNPLSLVTIAAIAGGGYLLQMFTGAEDSAKKSAESLKAFDALVERIGKTSQEAGAKIKAMLDTPATWAALKADIAETNRMLQGELGTAVQQLATDLQSLHVEGFKAQLLGMADPVQRTKEELARMGAELANGQMTAEQVKDRLDAMAAAQTTPASLYETIRALREVAITAIDAKAKMDALSGATAAQKTSAVPTTAQRLLDQKAAMGDPANINARMGTFDREKLVTDLNAQAKALNSVASAAAGAAKVDPFKNIVDGADRRLASLRTEAQALGMSAEAAAALKYQQDMLNQADQAGVKLTQTQVDLLRAKAEQMAHLEQTTKSAQESIALATDATTGFLSTLRQGLVAGEGWWQSLGNAALSVLDKIASAIETQIANQLVGSLGGLLGGSTFSPTTTLSGFLGLPGFAAGTKSAPGGLALVGERGPEVVNLPRGSQVIPNHKIGSAMGGSNVAFHSTMHITVAGNGDKELLANAEAAARAGMRSELSKFSKEALPKRMRQIAADPRKVG